MAGNTRLSDAPRASPRWPWTLAVAGAVIAIVVTVLAIEGTTTPKTLSSGSEYRGRIHKDTTTSSSPAILPTSYKWSTPVVAVPPPRSGEYTFTGLSCPSENFCVASGAGRVVYVSTDPDGTIPWRAVVLPGDGAGLETITCPSTRFCVAAGSDIYVSADPTGGSSAWRPQGLSNADVIGISCPTPGLCVAIKGESNMLVSTDPTGGHRAWKAFNWPIATNAYGIEFGAVSCPSVTLCVASGTGRVAVSTDPAGGTSTWKTAVIDPVGGIPGRQFANFVKGITCVGPNFCVAVDGTGGMIITTDPTGGPIAWHFSTVEDVQVWGTPSCPTTSFCGASLDTSNNQTGVVAAVNPLDGPQAWSPIHIEPRADFIACPNVNRCYLFGSNGTVSAGTGQ